MTSVGASEADISSLQENKSITLIFPVGWFWQSMQQVELLYTL